MSAILSTPIGETVRFGSMLHNEKLLETAGTNPMIRPFTENTSLKFISSAGPRYNIEWRRVSEKLFVPTNDLLQILSLKELDSMGLAQSKSVIIDGIQFLLRLPQEGSKSQEWTTYVGSDPSMRKGASLDWIEYSGRSSRKPNLKGFYNGKYRIVYGANDMIFDSFGLPCCYRPVLELVDHNPEFHLQMDSAYHFSKESFLSFLNNFLDSEIALGDEDEDLVWFSRCMKGSILTWAVIYSTGPKMKAFREAHKSWVAYTPLLQMGKYSEAYFFPNPDHAFICFTEAKKFFKTITLYQENKTMETITIQ